MKLGAILLNWRTPDMTIEALDALVLELRHRDDGWRVVIVDNDSGDGSEDVLRRAVEERRRGSALFQNVDVVQSGFNGGFGAGNNFGIRQLLEGPHVPDYIYILNSDAFVERGCVDALIDHLDAHSEVGIVGSYVHGTDGEPHVTAFRFPSIQSEIEGSLRLGVVTRALKDYEVPIGIPESTQDVDWLAGASMMIRRRVLEQIGLFDESFFLYFEETDLCRRAREAGHRVVYVKESSVAHIGSASTGMKTWTKVPDYWFDSRRHYFLKNHGRGYLAAATAARLAGTAVWQLRRRVQGKPDEDPPGFLGGLLGHSVRYLRRELTPR